MPVAAKVHTVIIRNLDIVRACIEWDFTYGKSFHLDFHRFITHCENMSRVNHIVGNGHTVARMPAPGYVCVEPLGKLAGVADIDLVPVVKAVRIPSVPYLFEVPLRPTQGI